MRLIKIEKGGLKNSPQYSYYARKKTVNNIRQMLLAAGYSTEKINELRKKDLILLSPGALSRTLKLKDSLYVLDPEEPVEQPKSLDRFKDL